MRMVKEDATDEEIIEALKISCAWDFVQHLPDTINSRVGERGRQRPNKTCIVTTHRPSVLGLCQRVYRVMNGTVTELDGAEGAKMVEDF